MHQCGKQDYRQAQNNGRPACAKESLHFAPFIRLDCENCNGRVWHRRGIET